MSTSSDMVIDYNPVKIVSIDETCTDMVNVLQTLRLSSRGVIYSSDVKGMMSVVCSSVGLVVRYRGENKYKEGQYNLVVEISNSAQQFFTDIVEFYGRVLGDTHAPKSVPDAIRIKYDPNQVALDLDWGDTTAEIYFTPKLYKMESDKDGAICGMYFTLHPMSSILGPSKKRSKYSNETEVIFDTPFFPEKPPVLKRQRAMMRK